MSISGLCVSRLAFTLIRHDVDRTTTSSQSPLAPLTRGEDPSSGLLPLWSLNTSCGHG